MRRHGDRNDASKSNFKFQNPKVLLHEWQDSLWSRTPSGILLMPFPGGVFLGFTSDDASEKRAFLFSSEDAAHIGRQLQKHAAVSKP